MIVLLVFISLLVILFTFFRLSPFPLTVIFFTCFQFLLRYFLLCSYTCPLCILIISSYIFPSLSVPSYCQYSSLDSSFYPVTSFSLSLHVPFPPPHFHASVARAFSICAPHSFFLLCTKKIKAGAKTSHIFALVSVQPRYEGLEPLITRIQRA